MSVRRIACVVVACDICGAEYGDDEGGGWRWDADGETEALRTAVEQGWVLDGPAGLLDAGPLVQCLQCTELIRCLADGHDWDQWAPCYCGGTYPPHGSGCPLVRYCRRCGGHEQAPSDGRSSADDRSCGGAW